MTTSAKRCVAENFCNYQLQFLSDGDEWKVEITCEPIICYPTLLWLIVAGGASVGVVILSVVLGAITLILALLFLNG